MKWFKHYSDAEFSESLSKLEARFGFEGLGRYWRFVEFLSRQFDGVHVCFAIESAKIRQLLRFRSLTDWRSFADQLTTIRGLKLEHIGTVCEINAPILLELQGRDFKKARSDRAETAPKIKNRIDKDKIKNNSSNGTQTKFEHPNNLQEFLAIFDEVIFAHWLSIYQNDADWINRELEKCYGYFYVQKTGKPSSSVKGWKSRASSWLERGWNSFSKTANQQTTKVDQRNQKSREILKMIEEGKI